MLTADAQCNTVVLFFCVISAIIHMVYFVVLQTGYRKGDLSVVYPLARGTGPLLSCLAAMFILGDPFNVFSVAGLIMIVSGVCVISRSSVQTQLSDHPRKGVLYGILTGCCIAAYTVCDNIAVKNYSVSPLLITAASNIFGAIVLLPYAVRHRIDVRAQFRSHRNSIIIIAAVSPLGYIMVLSALRSAPLVVVAPAREASIVFGVFMGTGLLRESNGIRRAIGAGLILAGIAALAFSKL